ncbi:non-ribosomal peptide synthetase [Photobacterium gaetbulicola]|nr:non-ribosomal peptide synthetase [Photobacterium gaetbulicola]
MSVIELLNELKLSGCKLEVEGSNLRVKGKLPSQFRDQVIAHKKEIISLLGNSRPPTLIKNSRNNANKFPAHNGQRGLWIVSQQEGAEAAYVEPGYRYYLKGNLDQDVLNRAFAELVRRHEIIRTTYQYTDQGLWQNIQPASGFEICSDDLRGCDEQEKSRREKAILEEESCRPFDLEKELMLRVRLIRFSEDEYLLFMVMHHIAMDGWSWRVITAELQSLYNSFAVGIDHALPEPAFQYTDYVHWRSKVQFEQNIAPSIAYWRKKLEGAPELHSLPLDYPRTNYQSFQSHVEQLQLSVAETTSLYQFAREQNVTLFAVLHALLAVVMSRHSGEKDIVVGSPFSGRTNYDFEAMVGFFVNTLVLRTELDGDLTFSDVLAQVSQTLREADQHQGVPFDMLVDKLNYSRSSAYSPVFQVMLVLLNMDLPQLDLEGVEQTSIGQPLYSQTKYDISLVCFEENGQLTLNFEYCSALFKPETLRRLAQHLHNIMACVVDNPRSKLSDIEMLTGEERDRLLTSHTGAMLPESSFCIHHLFEQQAATTPDAIALEHNGGTYSYRVLNQRANLLARTLAAAGVGPDRPVALCMDRTPELIIALLAVLKAGGAYVSVDPKYPQQRQAFILEDSGSHLLITEQAFHGNFPDFEHEIVVLEEHGGFASAPGAEIDSPETGVTPEHLSHLIYTSGSTGKPKGVMVEHRNVIALLDWAFKTYSPEELERVLFSTSLNFDLSVFELWAPLLSGGTVLLVDDVSQLVEESSLTPTLINTVPSALNALIAARAIPDSVETLNVAGEPLSQKLVNSAFSTSPIKRLYNLYGPSEDTTYSTFACFDGALQTEPCIGQPIDHTRAYVLDDELTLLPEGAIGELYLSGAGLARGYLNRDALTRSSFIANPFAGAVNERVATGHERLYKTGDLVRWGANGELEYIGRKDHQVKIRGFRIELGEIESALSGLNGVREQAVIVKSGDSGEKYLAGYVTVAETAEAGRGQAGEVIRSRLKALLPDHMIPAHITLLDSMPLTKNGKVDRLALQAIERVAQPGGTFVAPSTPLEETLLDLWQSVLGSRELGTHTNFFSAGGDSILAIQLVSKARKLGIKLTSQLLFEFQTIAQLAENVKVEQGLSGGEQPPAEGTQTLTPIMHAFFAGNPGQLSGAMNHYNQSMLFNVPELTREDLLRVLEALWQRHDVLRLSFDSKTLAAHYQPFTKAQVSRCLVELDLRDEEESLHQGIIQEAAERAQQQLQLERGELSRCLWIRQAQGDQLLWILHHLVTDGVSWRIIVDDISMACANLVDDSALLPRPGSVSFQDWAERMYGGVNQSRWLVDREYWIGENRVSGYLPPEYDNAQPAVESETEIVTVSLSEAETTDLQRATLSYNTRVNELLLAALTPVLVDWAGGKPLRIEMEGHGRDADDGEIDLGETVGWFTSIYPVSLVELGSIGQQVIAAKEKLRTIPNKGLGYGVLRYLMCDQALLASGQRADIVFNYLGQFAADDRLIALNSPLAGRHVSSQSLRQHKLGINGLVANGCLTFRFDYSNKQYSQSTIAAKANAFIQQLKAVIRHCLASERVYTASDFPLAGLSNEQLASLQRSIPRIDDIYPVTATQHGMLFHSLSNPGTAMYNNILKLGLGPIDVDLFKACWSQLLGRYEVLRTAFTDIGEDTACQVVVQECCPEWQELDWRDNQQLEANLAALIEREKRTSFDLSQAPLMRFTLIRETDESWSFVWLFHHALLDGWSIAMLLDELKELYEAKADPQPSRHSLPVVPYRHYVDWLQSRDIGDASKYWRERLGGFAEVTRLGAANNRKLADGGGKETVHLLLSEQMTRSLKSLAAGASVTLNAVMQGAWALLLSKYSNSGDVVFGQTVSGRSSELNQIERIVGPCINTLPVRVRVPDSDHSLNDWLQSLHSLYRIDEAYGFASLLDIQKWSEVKGGLFDTLLVFENYPSDIFRLDPASAGQGLHYRSIQAVEQNNYPLSVIVVPGDRLSIHIDYSTSYLAPADAERLAHNFKALLSNMAANGAKEVTELSLLDPVLSHLPSQVSDFFDGSECIHSRFEQVVAKTPDAVALVFDGKVMSYRELNRRANRLARQLIDAGVKPDSLVGLHTLRSFELVVGVLGILKSGAAYVPLDPNYPEQRVRYILDDAQLGIIVTDSHFEYAGDNQVVLCIEKAETCEADDNNPEIPGLSGLSLAYVIYTSGSTGNPKGVMVEHGNVVRLFAAADVEFSFDHRDVWTLFHSYAFDFSVWELWGALIYGARLVIVGYEATRSPEQFLDLLCEHRVTVLNQTPSAFYSLSRVAVKSGVKTALRYVVFGGEALDFNSLSDWFASYGDEQPAMINMYGITETTVHVTYQRIRQQDCEQPLSVIGKPLADLCAYVCDAQLNLLPVGVPGELLVGGKGVTRGYLNRPELTRERFIGNKFAPEQADVLYRSGDLVKWLEDGNLEYLGRIDQQVKIRGFRIELGEIESCLRKFPSIKQAAVFALAADGNHKRLVGYFEADKEVTSDQVRSYLSGELPDYMVPSMLIRVDAIPLTNNGKVNREALLALAGEQPSDDVVVPRTDKEMVLADVVGQILNKTQVSLTDNFFAIGGDSILSLRVVTLLKEKGYHCTVSDIFKANTIEQLADVLAVAENANTQRYREMSLLSDAEGARLNAVMRADGISDAYPASAMQAGMAYHAYLEPDSDVYHDVFSFKLALPWDEVCFKNALEIMVSRHELLRTGFVFDTEEGSLIQVVYETAEPQISVFDLRSDPQSKHREIVEGCISQERKTPFDMQDKSLLRLFIHRLDSNQFVLTLSFSHAILDGWSVSRFNIELLQGYTALLNGRQHQFEELPAPYHRFIEQEMDSRRDEDAKQFWSERLSEATVTALPFSEAGAINGERDSFYSDKLDGLKDQLVELAERLDVPLQHLLLAGHFKVLSIMSGDTDVLSGVVSNSRPALPGGDVTLGLFLNTLPLRCQLAQSSWAELITMVSRMATESIAHRMYPISDIQRQTSLEFNKVLFNYTHFHSYEALDSAGIAFEPYAKYEASNLTFVAQFIRMPSAELLLELQYPKHAGNKALIHQLESCYKLVFSSMAEQPEQSHCGVFDNLAELNLQTLPHNSSNAEPQLSVHRMIEQQVTQSPDATALVFDGTEMSYQVLNARANRLARYLIEQGAGHGSLVGVLLERSIDMVVSLLAIMKAGAAYVPLDPAFPADRINSVLADAECAVVICSPITAGLVCDSDIPKISPAEMWPRLDSHYSSKNIDVLVEDSSLAYVIYTSGSTGKPKGVQIEHQALSNFIAAVKARYATTEQDHTLALTTISFDIAALELYLPLVSGAICVLGSREDALSGLRVQTLVERYHIRLIQATPSGYQLLLESGEWRGSSQLQLLCGGEALSVPLAKQLITKGKKLWNQYGPTEATVWVTACEVTRSELEASEGYVALGGWLDNCAGVILNELGECVPLGVPGELYLSGVCLARGYFNRDDLTSACFIRHRLGGMPEQRLYKTGDKVRLNEAGRIEYLGRLDHQVKIRGHRIELGEIQAVLNRHSGVKESTVIADEGRNNKQLFAYFVPLDSAALENGTLIDELYSHLKERLPEYMIPAAVTALPSMPLTPNGKVDRKALPDPELAGGGGGMPLATPTEHQLAAIWQSVLELNERPYADSDFFVLGGHSLLAVKMAVRVRSQFGCELPLKVVLAERKLAQLAEFIDSVAVATCRPTLTKRAVQSRRLPTFAQQRMWFIEQVPNGAGLYNMPMVVNLQGELDIVRLSQVIKRRVLRFEALRTVFDSRGDELEMELLSGDSFELTVTDLSGLSEGDKYPAAQALAERNAKRAFDLSRDVLLRGELVVLAEQQYQLILTMHHIASDGWSWGVFIDEINRDYNNRASGGPELAELPIEVADFAEVQRLWLASEKETLLEYWQQQLADLPVLHSIPADFKRPTVQDYRGSQHHFKLAPALVARLKACCEEQNITLFVLLQTAFSVLLNRYSGESDIVMGTPVAGREYEELENQVGLFVNTVVLRNEVSGDSTIAQQLQQGRLMVSAALEHQAVPFEWLVDSLSPERTTAHTPLFQVLFAMQNVKQPALALNNITAEMVIPQETVSRFDLSLYCHEEEQGIGCFFEYALALFQPETIDRMSRHFENLLVDIAGSMEKKVSELEMLDGRQQRFMLEEWNQTDTAYSKDRLIHHVIEHQVSLTPNAIALSYDGQALSYAELNERANQMAHYLLQHVDSTGPDTLVGVCMERSIEMVISLVAILKAGMAYVPFDPGYPPARLDYMLQDSGVDIVLLQDGLLTASQYRKDVVVDHQFVGTVLAQYPTSNPVLDIGLSDLAYVIYTSGSTGKPKGVMVGHGAILNRLQWMQEVFGLTDQDKVLQKTPFSFDVSVWEFFWPLMYGAQLVVAKPGGHKNSTYLAELIAEQGITTLHFVPSMLQLFVEEPALAKCDSLRYVFCSGEALPYDLQQRFFDMHPTAELHNLYGPTEAAVDVTWWPCQRGANSGRVPIGRPIANIQTLVLDQQLQPVPIGVPGELYLGGVGLARGYRNKPELTDSSFIPHPFTSEASRRLYKTGDKVRWLADGSLEYLGRFDHQIKLRGFRIELGEIESALLEMKEVREAIVMVNQDRGTPLLVAYVVVTSPAKGQDSLSTDELKKHLKAHLPEFLVPAQIIAVAQMPLTPNGKLDRKALPAPDFSEQGTFVSPKTEVEQSLSDIWHQLLSVRSSVDRSFFDVGGHSLLAIKVISLVKQRYPQVNITVQTMFERQTIELLAEEIEQQLYIIENQTSFEKLADMADVLEVEF